MDLVQEGWKNPLSGLIVGHLYFYFKEILPRSSRKRILETPKIL